jgi:hypothetical protein
MISAQMKTTEIETLWKLVKADGENVTFVTDWMD